MKLLYFVLLLARVAVAQDFRNQLNENNVIASEVTDQFLDGLTYWLDSKITEVRDLVIELDLTISNLMNSVIGSVSNRINNTMSSIDDLRAKAQDSEKLLDDCGNVVNDLELLNQKTSNLVTVCKSNFDKELASVSADLTKKRDLGNEVISSFTKSLSNCGNVLFVDCISNEQQSTLLEIRGIVDSLQNLTEKIFLSSEKSKKCTIDAKENGYRSIDQNYQAMQHCVSN